MSTVRHLLLRASAGTGKTHRLSNRYLALLLGGADAGTILATTFTRKAAHEILERVLQKLAAGASDPAKLASLEGEIGRRASREECLDHLARLVRRMDRLQIGTIDAFFAQLARLFALEIGLPAGWRIADDAERDALVAAAASEALAGAESDALLELLRDFQKQAAERSVHEALVRFGERGREILRESTREAWTRIRPLPDADEEALKSAVAALPALRLPRTKAGLEHDGWSKCRRTLVECVERGAWIDVLAVGLAEKVCAGETTFFRHAIEDHHVAVIGPIVEHALHVATAELVRQNEAARGLLEAHETSYETLSRGRGLLQFHDLPDALARGALARSEDSRRDLARRLDGRIDHLLLDEFQDTAPVQWRVLRPIADEIVGDATGERTFFCVGDEKQSIYGWRGAEPRLLAGLASKRPSLAVEGMHESYRSSRAVLGTVNQVFGTLGSNPAFVDSKGDARKEAEAARAFAKDFPRHDPAPGVDVPGAAFLVQAPAPTDAAQRPVLALAVGRVREILADAPRATVGVLVRTRKWIPELIHLLRVEGFSASDEGGNPLTDSIAVLHALSLLHLADHPEDRAALFHVATSALARKIGIAPDAEEAGEAARRVRGELAALGYGGFLASIRPVENDGYGAWDARRFGQLVDLALAWEVRAGSRPSAFVDHVRKTKVEDPTAAQVRVMTVHGSKGLEFDAVVLPELDAPLGRREDGLWTSRPDPEGPIETVTHGLRKELAAAHRALESVRLDLAQRRATEELCILYVAMTRARHRLDLVVEHPDARRGGLSYASILRAALVPSAAADDVELWRHAENRSPWFRPEIAHAAESGGAPETRIPLRFAPSKRPRSLPGFSPSRAKDVGPIRASRLLRPVAAITARGRVLHRLLQEVEWIETFDRTDEDLIAIGRRIEPDEATVRSTVEEFRAVLAHPVARASLSSPGDDARVRREQRFAFVRKDDGAEAMWTGAFDRVVLRKGSAEILDFKTDRALDAEAYRPQMEAYRQALARTTGLAETAIATTLLFVSADSVERVSP